MISHVYLNTKESTNLFNNNPCDANFLLQQNLSDNVEYYQVSLNSMSFPNVVEPFRNGSNNKIDFCENLNIAQVFTCNITQGGYDGSGLASEIQTRMNAVVGKANIYSVSYNSGSKKITISTNGGSFSLRSTSTCLYELGFTIGQNTAFNTSWTGTNLVSLSGLRFVDVMVSFGTGSYSSNNRGNILNRIYMEYPYGSINSYRKYVDSDYCVVSAEDLQFLELRIFDDNGRLVVLPSNQFITYDLIIKAMM